MLQVLSPSFTVCHLFPAPPSWAASLSSGRWNKSHAPGGSNSSRLFLTVLEGGPAEIRPLAALVGGEDRLPGSRTRLGHVPTWPVLGVRAQRARESSSPVSASHEVTSPTGGPTLVASGSPIAS